MSRCRSRRLARLDLADSNERPHPRRIEQRVCVLIAESGVNKRIAQDDWSTSLLCWDVFWFSTTC